MGEPVAIAFPVIGGVGQSRATHLEGLSEEAIMELDLPTGIPILYELDRNLKPVGPLQFLGDKEAVKKAMGAVAAQGKAKT